MLGAKKKLFVAHRYNTVVIVGEGYYKRRGARIIRPLPQKSPILEYQRQFDLLQIPLPPKRKYNS